MVTLINIRPLDIRATLAALILVLCMVPVSLFASEDKFIDGLSAYVSGNYDKAADIWHPLAQQGHSEAQFYLGRMYDDGNGMPQDDAEAVKWYRRAAEQGYASAQFNLGFMYGNGHGVPQDYAKAVTWYRRAAEQGDADAQNNLGFMYDKGRGVPQNYVLAHMWFNLAASKGHELSLGSADGELGNRDIVARQMTSEQIARAQALAARCLASDYRDCGE